MNIIVTGSGGFIGKHLCSYLKHEHSVIGIGSKQIDLRESNRVKDAFRNFKNIDAVIHLAARLSTANDMSILYDNIKITENLADSIKLFKPRKVINISSIAVYPNKEGIYKETSEIDPSFNTESSYGISKFCSEQIFNSYLKNEPIVISHLRLAQVYGEGMREDRLISIMLKELREKNTITVFGNGKRLSNFINIDKLNKIISVFIEKDYPGVYNVGEENLSYLKLAERLIKKYGKKESKIIKMASGSKAKFFLDTSKLRKILAYA
ncbi:NAD(P)-dependent oxidoreductase [bacterium]|nr:MAG: NAD(P)-dependent oxidoreductase [bacterium]